MSNVPADLQADGGMDFELSLVKLTGRKIKDIRGHLSYEFGQANLKLTEIIFEDDSAVYIEGEHDFPYLGSYGSKHAAALGLDDDRMEALYTLIEGEDDEDEEGDDDE